MTDILIPLPSRGFDPTEVAVPWKVLTGLGHDVHFTTPSGDVGEVDSKMLDGNGLGILKPVLMARRDAVEAYHEMTACSAFQSPVAYSALKDDDYSGLLLPGGHDKPVREYLESEVLQLFVATFFSMKKPVGAICHGVVLMARCISTETGKSILHGYKTTALLEKQEKLAFNMTRLWLGDYYLTYPGKTVEGEVRAALAEQSDFQEGPPPMLRDSPEKMGRGYTVLDRHYLSARWPGDAYSFSVAFDALLKNTNKALAS
ncbi:MAG: DJ-1/PfpI family protein [Kordiimonadaceae bacterium]|nr:DJ-1/PfpI family protein [Kordiimonadaceae bacterium]